MMGFAGILDDEEISAVVDFVLTTFVKNKGENTRYHIPENGWENHQQYAIAFPFARGEIKLDTPWEALTPEQRRGKTLFMTSCITCHDRARVDQEGAAWESRPVSIPRGAYSHRKDDQQEDVVTGATPYARHEIAPVIENLTAQERRGEQLYQKNCAFCHAADGSGKNWIGSFLEPHPRNLTDRQFISGMDRQKLLTAISDGLPDTTMPAWKSVLDSEDIEALAVYVERAFFEPG